MNFRNNDATAVVAMIDAIPEATLETEASVEAAYAAYCALEDNSQTQVTNFERLKTLRDEIADLYEVKLDGSRVDRSKILIGSYNLKYFEEEDIQDLVDCNIDFMTGVHDLSALDILEKHNIGAFTDCWVLGIRHWRGNPRYHGVEEYAPFGEEEFKASMPELSTFDHNALWGIWLVDEPNSQDFAFHEMQRSAMQEKYPNLLSYINLYADVAGDRLGIPSNAREYDELDYQEYMDLYVETVDSDYICYDHYMYREGGHVQLDLTTKELMVIAKACRENNREFWMWLQANFPADDGTSISLNQMRFQANVLMAFGGTGMIWGCWAPGWYYQNILDNEGNKTQQYDKLKVVNAETKELSPVIIKYKSIDNSVIGGKHPNMAYFYKYDDNYIDQNVFVDMKVKDSELSGESVLCGYFEKKIGDGSAMMFVNITDETCREREIWEELEPSIVKFKISAENAVVTEHTAHGSYILKPDADGYYKVSVENAAYSFVTVE